MLIAYAPILKIKHIYANYDICKIDLIIREWYKKEAEKEGI